jgi:hypothetical protein
MPQIPQTKADFHWPRTGTLEFAKYYLQRNGMDPQTGLMLGVQGASYNHNHCNGMSMELYGCGIEMGIDAGSGPNYEHQLHMNYCAQWAAHNTVVAAGISSSVPFNGSAGPKNIGNIELAAMEPLPDQEAVSPDYSFTDTRYLDISTQSNESRTLAIIRTSPTTGYYVDIFRSDNPVSNDYVYHNIGDKVTFFNDKREPLSTIDTKYPLTGKDYPGFRFFTNVKSLNSYTGNLIAQFLVKNDKNEDTYLQALIAGNEGRTYYQAYSPKTKTSGKVYHDKDLPLFTIRTENEARTKPFAVIFEPYKGENGFSVEKIATEKINEDYASLIVLCKGGKRQHILQANDPAKTFDSAAGNFKGYFGVASYSGNHLSALYLGKGSAISEGGYSLRSKTENGSASLKAEGNNWKVSSNQETEVLLPLKGIKKVYLKTAAGQRELKYIIGEHGTILSIPMVKDGLLVIN